MNVNKCFKQVTDIAGRKKTEMRSMKLCFCFVLSIFFNEFTDIHGLLGVILKRMHKVSKAQKKETNEIMNSVIFNYEFQYLFILFTQTATYRQDFCHYIIISKI